MFLRPARGNSTRERSGLNIPRTKHNGVNDEEQNSYVLGFQNKNRHKIKEHHDIFKTSVKRYFN